MEYKTFSSHRHLLSYLDDYIVYQPWKRKENISRVISPGSRAMCATHQSTPINREMRVGFMRLKDTHIRSLHIPSSSIRLYLFSCHIALAGHMRVSLKVNHYHKRLIVGGPRIHELT